jgi:hypothetical protein
MCCHCWLMFCVSADLDVKEGDSPRHGWQTFNSSRICYSPQCQAHRFRFQQRRCRRICRWPPCEHGVKAVFTDNQIVPQYTLLGSLVGSSRLAAFDLGVPLAPAPAMLEQPANSIVPSITVPTKIKSRFIAYLYS